MLEPATFYATDYDPTTQTSFIVELFLDRVYFDPGDPSMVGLKLAIEEVDNFGLLALSLSPRAGMANVSRPFTFIGIPLTAYLNYNPAAATTASLASFSLTADFIEPQL
jgi:hypothetical protein